MAKYSYEFKKKVVMEYLNGEGSQQDLMQKHNIPAKRSIQDWIANYKDFGDEGLMRSRKNNTYTFEYKLHMVELYLSSEVSYLELALSQGMGNSSLIAQWVNDFRTIGPDALRPKKKGRKKSLDTKKTEKITEVVVETTNTDTSAERIKQLEDELLKLRIENAYLKELRRLRLEEEALLRKQRESSTASEENSN